MFPSGANDKGARPKPRPSLLLHLLKLAAQLVKLFYDFQVVSLDKLMS